MLSQTIAKKTLEEKKNYKTMEELIEWQVSFDTTIKSFDSYIIQGNYVVVHKESGECYFTEGLPDITELVDFASD